MGGDSRASDRLDDDYKCFWIRNGRPAKNFGDTFKRVQLTHSDRAAMTIAQWRHWSFQTNAMWRSIKLEDPGLAAMQNLGREIKWGAETAGHTVEVEWESYSADPLVGGGPLRDWRSHEVQLRWHLLLGWEPKVQSVTAEASLRAAPPSTTQTASNGPITPSQVPQQPTVSMYSGAALQSLRSCFGFNTFKSTYQEKATCTVFAALRNSVSPVVQLALSTNAGKTAAVLGPILAHDHPRLVLYIVHSDVLITDLLKRLENSIPSAQQTASSNNQARPSPRFARVRPRDFARLKSELETIWSSDGRDLLLPSSLVLVCTVEGLLSESDIVDGLRNPQLPVNWTESTSAWLGWTLRVARERQRLVVVHDEVQMVLTSKEAFRPLLGKSFDHFSTMLLAARTGAELRVPVILISATMPKQYTVDFFKAALGEELARDILTRDGNHWWALHEPPCKPQNRLLCRQIAERLSGPEIGDLALSLIHI